MKKRVTEPEPEKRMVRLRVFICAACVQRMHRSALDSVRWCSECLHFSELEQPAGKTMRCPHNTRKQASDICQAYDEEVPEEI